VPFVPDTFSASVLALRAERPFSQAIAAKMPMNIVGTFSDALPAPTYSISNRFSPKN
jgi:hypothetical protein